MLFKRIVAIAAVAVSAAAQPNEIRRLDGFTPEPIERSRKNGN